MNYFREYVNPYLGELLKKIEMDKTFNKGKGCYLFDDNNNKYLDCIANYGAVPFGHNPPELWQEIINFKDNKTPSFIKPSALEKAGKLAKKINELTADNLQYTTFTNSGAEAVEAAIKLSRSATGKKGILATENSFHGKTLGALSATGNQEYQESFSVPFEDFIHIEYGNIEALKHKLENNSDKIAAFIVEPIQGEGGIITPPDNYLKKAQNICEKHNVLFILDEIQTGLGRTGKLFAYQYKELKPDILLLAKALGGGMVPVGACISSEKAYNENFARKHSSTFAGNSLVCHIGLKVLELLTADNNQIIKDVRKKGQYLKNLLEKAKTNYPELIKSIRGKGYMLGIEFVNTREVFPNSLLGIMTEQDLLTPVISSFLLNNENLRVAPTLNGKNVIRIEPPLIMDKKQCRKIYESMCNMLEILQQKNTARFISYLIDNQKENGKTTEKIKKFEPTTSTAKKSSISLSPSGKSAEGRFAFLIHPIDFKNYYEFDESLKSFSKKQLSKLTARWNDMVEPFSVAKTKIKSKSGAKAFGEFIVVPRTTKKLLDMPKKKSLNLIKEAINIAQNNGAKIVGLGAYTAVITMGGLYVRNEGIPITTGNSYTVVAAVEAVKKALNKLNMAPSNSRAAIVGATGSIGKGASTLLAKSVSHLSLIGNPEHKKSSINRLYRVAGEIYKYIAELMDNGHTFTHNTLGYKLKNNNLPSVDSSLNTFIEYAKKKDNKPIEVTTSIENSIPMADVTIVATNTVETLITPKHLKAGAIVCDISRPKNVSKKIDKNRPDVLVIDGGVIEVPGKPSMGWNFGFEKGLVYACMAETMMLALENKYENFSLGSSGVNRENILYTKNLAQKHGFKLAKLRSFDRPLSSKKWESIITARKQEEISV